MTPLHNIDIAAHVTFGTMGLLLGLVPLLSEKGSKQHRKYGKLFIGVASLVILSAMLTFVVGYRASPVADAALILSAGYQLAGGVRALHLRDHGPTLVDAGMACIALSMAAGLIFYDILNVHNVNGAYTFIPAVAWVSFVALYDLSRHAWSTFWLHTVRPLDHGLKLTGMFFAMFAAASGNLLMTFHPWSIIVPNIMGLCAMILLAAIYVRRVQQSGRLRANV